MRQLGVAMITYTAENKDCFPHYDPAFAPTHDLVRYFANDLVLMCPSAPDPVAAPESVVGGYLLGGASFAYVEGRIDLTGDGVNDLLIGGYGRNGMANRMGAWPSQFVPVENYFDRIDATDARVPLFADCMWTAGFPGATFGSGDQPSMWEYGPDMPLDSFGLPRFAIRRHEHNINVVFADGHARGVYLPDLWTLRWHANWKDQGPMNLPWLNE